MPRPNIIVILCDDLGYGDVGALSSASRTAERPAIATPELDSMAAAGMTLHGMYCSAPVCAPSRASLLTGMLQGQCALRDNDFDAALQDGPGLARVLQHAGYRTAAVGKWGLPGHLPDGVEPGPSTWPAYPSRRGFEEFFGYVRHADGHEHYPKEGLYRGAKQVWHDDAEISASLDRCYTTDLFTAFAKDWITRAAADGDRPFFLYLAFDTPHAVQELPAGPYPEGSGLRGGLRWLGEPGRMISTADGTPDSWVHPDYLAATDPASGEPWADVYRRYATAVRRIDSSVGDLRGLLEDLGIAQDTLVLFTSDNGPSIESYLAEDLEADFLRSFGPFDGIKRDCWEGGVRVGALTAWPGRIGAGTASEDPVQFHDLLPTFAELAQAHPPACTDGVSLVPLLTGTGEQRESRIYVEYAGPDATPDYADFAPSRRGRMRGQMQMLRLGDLVGVRYDIHDPAEPFEIYDIVADPGERDDLGADPALQARFRTAAARRRAIHPEVARPYDSELMPALAEAEPGPPAVTLVTDDPEVLRTPWLTDPRHGPEVRWAAGSADVGRLHVVTGTVSVPRDGFYRVEVEAPEAVVRVHDATVLNTMAAAAAPVGLAAGRHPFLLVARVPGAGTNRTLDAAATGCIGPIGSSSVRFVPERDDLASPVLAQPPVVRGDNDGARPVG